MAAFDISENNPNVMLEAGLALGSSKPIVMLKNRESEVEFPRPSDLVGYISLLYDGEESLATPQVVVQLEAAVLKFVHRPPEPEQRFRDVWGFGEHDDVTVVCSELDEAEALQHPEPWEYIYLSKYGDLDALFEAQSTIHELYPNAHVEHGTGNEIWEQRDPDRFSGNLVLVGGPDYNRMTEALSQYSPVEYLPAGADNNISIRGGRPLETLTPYKRGRGSEEVIDFGFFINRLNPHNPEKRLVMIGGCHTYGVYGAIRAFSYSRRRPDPIAARNCKIVVERLGTRIPFCAIFEVHGIGKSVATPQVNPNRLWKLSR